MRISDAERYGMRVMFYLAIQGLKDPKPKTLKDISTDKKISRNYIANIMPKLCRANLVKSIKGKYGGYLLAKEPEEISYMDILNAFDAKLGMFECLVDPSVCKHSKTCPRRDFWNMMCEGICQQLSKYTLKDALKHYMDQPNHYVPFCEIDNKRSKFHMLSCKKMNLKDAANKDGICFL